MPSSVRLATRLPGFFKPATRSFTTTFSRRAEQSPQTHPIGPFYEAILAAPQNFPANKLDGKFEHDEPAVSSVKKEENQEAPGKKKPGRKPKAAENQTETSLANAPPTSSMHTASQSSAFTTVEATPASVEERAQRVFGSRHLSPGDRGYEERQRLKTEKSTLVNGVLIPPEPEEPDNCCMSGCVNCVWERFREEMEEWSAKKSQAAGSLATQGSQEASKSISSDSVSMDDDGGGSHTNWGVSDTTIAKDLWDDDVFKGVPMGIREFMKQEKRLKERHEREKRDAS